MRLALFAYRLFDRWVLTGTIAVLLYLSWAAQHIASPIAIYLSAASMLLLWALTAHTARQLILYRLERTRLELVTASPSAEALLHELDARLRV